jgi:ATP-dependent DNA helicase PIF1
MSSSSSSPAAAVVAPVSLTPSQRLAEQLVLRGKNVLITGPGGGGKSYLLKHLIKILPTQGTYITASTGIAAIPLAGTTFHSWGGLGIDPNVPIVELLKKINGTKALRERWSYTRVLIIEELSMLDAPCFELAERVARSIRKKSSHLPFGGIHLIMAGDFLQLPPVPPHNNNGSGGSQHAKMLFQSPVWNKCFPSSQIVLLEQVFRQRNNTTVDALAKIRLGIVDESVLSVIRPCINRPLESITKDGIIPTFLYPKRLNVDGHNQTALNNLKGKQQKYTAVDKSSNPISRDALKRNCLAPDLLELKVGAQVMMLKNAKIEINADKVIRLVNGSRGVVTGFKEYSKVLYPVVRWKCGEAIPMRAMTWEMRSQGEVVATRSQVPLILAWAITIHKAQGMQLDCVQTKLEDCFENGQVYTTLSRVSDFDYLRIEGSFPVSKIKAHPGALQFYKELEERKRKTEKEQEQEEEEEEPKKKRQRTEQVK